MFVIGVVYIRTICLSSDDSNQLDGHSRIRFFLSEGDHGIVMIQTEEDRTGVWCDDTQTFGTAEGYLACFESGYG